LNAIKDDSLSNEMKNNEELKVQHKYAQRFQRIWWKTIKINLIVATNLLIFLQKLIKCNELSAKAKRMIR